ncbi:hypothetical protein WA026_005632 [Henosepilachna vigintioctopunctata]|uniref:Protein sleepless n=1 Tax=Henosepilachna vigintioctopunctata TaxID=420089 RepID=A0AAW1U2D4_9CUCU
MVCMMSSSNIFTIIPIFAFFLGLSHFGETLECYKCGVYSQPDPSKCQYIDDETKTITCKDDEKYCSAIGLNHVQLDGNITYSNIRGCDKDAFTCVRAFWAYGTNIRNCHVCETDRCNSGPLISAFEASTSTVELEPNGGSPDGNPSEQQGPSNSSYTAGGASS